MSESLNSVTVSGNLYADAEVRRSQAGNAVTTLTLAVKDRRPKGDGTYEDVADPVGVVVFGKRGEALSPYLTKGAKIAIVGHLRSSSWEKDGVKHRKLEVVADQIELMTMPRDKKKPAPAASAPASPSAAKPPAYDPALQAMVNASMPPSYQPAGIYDDEIPF